MPTGSIWIAAALAEQAAPLAGVRVTVLDETGVPVARLETGEDGTAVQDNLPAPDRSYSLEENNTTVRPYAVYDLVAEKDGWQTVRLTGVQVFDGQETVARMNFLPADAAVATAGIVAESNVDIPPHPLFSGRGGSGPAPAGNCPGPRVLTEVVIPKTITVHLGRPTESARNVTVPFQSYIANVASGEVYPTWAGQAQPRLKGPVDFHRAGSVLSGGGKHPHLRHQQTDQGPVQLGQGGGLGQPLSHRGPAGFGVGLGLQGPQPLFQLGNLPVKPSVHG